MSARFEPKNHRSRPPVIGSYYRAVAREGHRGAIFYPKNTNGLPFINKGPNSKTFLPTKISATTAKGDSHLRLLIRHSGRSKGALINMYNLASLSDEAIAGSRMVTIWVQVKIG